MSTDCSETPFSLEPVRKPEQFFGREKETRRTLSFLHRLQSVSVVGSAKIGKTSFLFHVAHSNIRERDRFAEEQVFVYLDGRSLADCDQDQCYLSILHEAIRQAQGAPSVDETIGVELGRTAREVSLQTAYFGLLTLFRTAQANDLKLIVLLDNFEFLTQNSHLEDHFFSSLRSLATNYRMAYFVTSQYPLDTLERIRQETSPFFNIFQSITLNPLTLEESRELVATLLKQAEVEFPEFAIDLVLELGHNKPYRLQRAGHIAFQVWQENKGVLQAKHCEGIRRRFAESAMGALHP